ncbi:DUF6046 domain-containing protein [Capnocytophaga sputigena]|uniref:DUF6046 domain-containing protein n=1 Tax=Capnocytophaga sputigena TaxID=1019 RepID=UPI003C77330D
MENGQSIVLDLASRYGRALGIVLSSEGINQVVITKEDNKYQVETFGETTNFEEVTMEYENTRLVFNSFIGGEQSTVFAPPPILSFSRSKKLIETETNGSTIVERWNTNEWEITIQGILVDIENHNYPDSQIQQIVTLFEHNDIIKVVGAQFYDKGIDSIYIDSITINPKEGYSDTVAYTLSAKSAKEVTFNLLEGDGK